MNLHLDTHSFLWYVWDASRLTEAVATAIEDPNNTVYVSIVSLWEIALKSSLGKLTLELPIADFFDKHVDGNGFLLLPVTRPHLHTLYNLPFHHRDPFDRLLIAQSVTEGMVFVTHDAEAAKYAVTCMWD